MPLRCTSMLFLLLAAATLGCDRSGDSRLTWKGTIDTLTGGVVRVPHPSDGLWSDSERWRLEETLRIGRVEPEGPEQFAFVKDTALDPLDRIRVTDGPSMELRVFDTRVYGAATPACDGLASTPSLARDRRRPKLGVCLPLRVVGTGGLP